jgi:hypothetical protein
MAAVICDAIYNAVVLMPVFNKKSEIFASALGKISDCLISLAYFPRGYLLQ